MAFPSLQARRIILFAALAAVLGVTGVWLASSRSAALSEVERLQNKLEISRGDAGAEIESLESDIDDLTSDLDSLRSEFDASSEARISELEELERINEEIRLAAQENATLSAALGLIGDLEIALMVDLTGSGLELAREFADLHGATLIFETAAPGNMIARPGAIFSQIPIAGTPVIPGSVIWVQVFSP